MSYTAPPLALFSQADAKSLSNGLLVKMLNSVAAQKWPAAVNVYVSLNHAGPDTAKDLEQTYPFLTIRRTAGQLSLSANRNLLLREFLSRVPDNALVAFPDDDAYYKPGLLANIVEELQSRNLDYLATSTNDPDDSHHPRFSNVPKSFDVITAMDNVNSNTLFLKGALAKKVGLFAEDFGLGTPAVGGEDNEYALRMLQISTNGAYSPQHIVGHPVKVGFGHKYYPAGVLIYARHKHMLRGKVRPLFMLKHFVKGLILISQRKISLKLFTTTWIRVTKEFFV